MVSVQDFVQIPCMRQSTLNGIYSGLAGLVLALIVTSRPSLAADVGFGTFWVVTMGSFVYCRKKREETVAFVEHIHDEKGIFKIESKSDEV